MTSPHDGPDHPSHGHEYPSLEKAPPPDAYAPVDYPTDSGQPTAAFPGQFGYPQPDYSQSGYPQPDYSQPGYPQPDYPQASMPGAPYQQQYPGAYPYAYDPYRAAQPAGTNGKAIASLILSLVGLILCGLPSIVGLILGIMGMRETKRTRQEGHGLALVGVIVGAVAVAGWLLYVAVIIFAFAVTSTSPSYY